MSFMGYNTRSILPYAEALLKLPAHIQQLDMEVRDQYVLIQIRRNSFLRLFTLVKWQALYQRWV